MDYGRFFTEDENRSRARVVLLGRTVARELFAGQNPIGETIKVNRIPFQVIGLLPEKGTTAWRDQDDYIVMPLLTAMHRVLGKDYVDYVDIEVSSADLMEAAQREIEEALITRKRVPPSQQRDAYQIRKMAAIQSALAETSRTMSYLLATIAAISLVVGGVGIMNIMLVSVTESPGSTRYCQRSIDVSQSRDRCQPCSGKYRPNLRSAPCATRFARS